MNFTGKELEEIFTRCFVIKPPAHVMVLDRPLVYPEMTRGGVSLRFFSGAFPVWAKNVIILSPQATMETVLHESIHENFGFGELLTYPLGRLAAMINSARRRRGLRDVRYKECQGCVLCMEPERVGLRVPEGGKITHYVLDKRW